MRPRPHGLWASGFGLPVSRIQSLEPWVQPWHLLEPAGVRTRTLRPVAVPRHLISWLHLDWAASRPSCWEASCGAGLRVNSRHSPPYVCLGLSEPRLFLDWPTWHLPGASVEASAWLVPSFSRVHLSFSSLGPCSEQWALLLAFTGLPCLAMAPLTWVLTPGTPFPARWGLIC